MATRGCKLHHIRAYIVFLLGSTASGLCQRGEFVILFIVLPGVASYLSLDRKTLHRHLWLPRWLPKTVFTGDTGRNHVARVWASEKCPEQ